MGIAVSFQALDALAHEIGHTLGLADEGAKGKYGEGASTTHRSAKGAGFSIMDSIHGLTDDDADGLINMIDSWRIFDAQKKHPKDWQKRISARVLNGWDSLLQVNGKHFDRYKMGTSETLLSK